MYRTINNIYSIKVPDRSPTLGVALSTTGGLQAAIDSAKHGSKHEHNTSISIQHILYGKGETVYTLVVDYNTTREKVLKRWYSLLPLNILDLAVDIVECERSGYSTSTSKPNYCRADFFLRHKYTYVRLVTEIVYRYTAATGQR